MPVGLVWAAIWRRAGCVLAVGLMAAGVGASGFDARAWGQSSVDGAIAGRVVSAEGEAIAGAELVLVGEEGERRTVVSGRHGEFLMIRLTPGTYRLMARASGYRGQVEIEATVELGRTTELEVGHAVVPRGSAGRSSERGGGGIRLGPIVEPNARRRLAVVDARESALRRDPDAMVVARAELEALPVAGRDWTSLVAETPGVEADPDADGQSLLTVRGLPATENSSRIDGMSHDQSFGAVPVGTGAGVGREAEDDADQGGPVVSGGVVAEDSGMGGTRGRRTRFRRRRCGSSG